MQTSPTTGSLRRMTAQGLLSVVLITHKIREVLSFADVVTVMRDGRKVGEGAGLQRHELEQLMFGRAISARSASRSTIST